MKTIYRHLPAVLLFAIIGYTAYSVAWSQSTRHTFVRQSSGPAYWERVNRSKELAFRGHAAWKRGELAPAETALRESLRIDPGNPTRLYWLAQVLDEQGKPNEALAAYREVVHPQSGWGSSLTDEPAIWFRYAHLADAAGQRQEALLAYQGAINKTKSLGPDYPGLPMPKGSLAEARTLAYVAYGIDLERRGDRVKATEAYAEAARMGPNLAIAHFYAGHALESQGKTEAARAAFERAASLGSGAIKAAAEAALR